MRVSEYIIRVWMTTIKIENKTTSVNEVTADIISKLFISTMNSEDYYFANFTDFIEAYS